MKKRIWILALCLALCLTACGGGKSDGGEAYDSSASMANGADMGLGNDFLTMDAEAPQSPAEEAQPGATGEADRPAKMIYTAWLELETLTFEEASSGLERLAREMGGYIQNSEARTGGSGYRWANFTVRVPQERFQEFLDRAGELCHQTWRSINQEDVSEPYYDTAGRLKTQQIKLERLQELLSQAEAMEDIITIESAISETEYQIDSLSGELRRYDSLVDLSTVNVSLQEVYKLSNVEEAPVSFTGRISSAFTSGLSAFLDWLEDVAVAAAYSWLWLLLAAVVIVVVFRLLRWRHRARKAARQAAETPQEPDRKEK